MQKILIVEDDAILLEMYQDKFVKEGFTVETAVDGKAGIEKMRTFRPDAVLLDLMMPKMTGFSVLELVKGEENLKNIPIIVLTNIYADAQDLLQNWGVKHFLLKANYTPEQVVEKVKQTIIPQAA
ncbi:MAG: response regulator [Patescibacteria group bacterium]